MNVLIFGGRGYLAQKFLTVYPEAVLAQADIADPASVREALDSVKPDIVINAAGKTGVPNVDWCEEHKLETLRSNVTGPLVLLEECRRRGIAWVHLSSGCIYEGDNGGRGWTEEDEPNFTGSFYSRSKALCERSLREFTDPQEGRGGILILRLRMPFDGIDHPKNLITKLSHYPRVNDCENSITHMPDFLLAAQALIAKRATGIYNVVNEGAISPYRIMELYRQIVDPDHTFDRLLVDTQTQSGRGSRSNCILSTGKLKREGILLQTAEEAVRRALWNMKKRPAHRAKEETENKICIHC
ncbi:MAG: sugar nucleotide-binding protein [Candidatus Peregrinibacteria bacterium]